jgi:hypothetical protein
VVETTDIKYRAFLSYAHADTARARWLHARLEGFAIDKDLVGRDTERGPVPKALRPIFRDREDFSGGHRLPDQTPTARNSHIGSRWRHAFHRGRRQHAVIAARCTVGAPHPAISCLPAFRTPTYTARGRARHCRHPKCST